MKEINPYLPVNKQSKIVVSREPEKSEFKNHKHITSMVPLPVVKFKGKPEFDLTGKRSGRLIVIGQFIIKKQDIPSRWVVRCSCGRYEVRKAKTLKKENPSGSQSMCSQCDITSHLKWKINNDPQPNIPL